MNDLASLALLPAGLRDLLPHDAAREADAVTRIMGHFGAHGYERVKPPLIEFEETLLGGSGAAMAPHSFRLMDPVSQRMLAIRADMTLQVARIAATRLDRAPRPLRLSYAGEVLRVKGSQIRPERQFTQAGIELIGANSPAADAEAVVLAAGALAVLGVEDVTIDLALPLLVPALYRGHDLPQGMREALDHKDVTSVRAAGTNAKLAELLVSLIEAGGSADRALAHLAGLGLPSGTDRMLGDVAEVVRLVREAAPDLVLTIDFVENRGFEYHSGIAFTLFSRRHSAELGRGGRYQAGSEPATGATLFLDSVLEAAPGLDLERRLFVPFGTAPALAAKWRGQGWVTVAGLVPVTHNEAEARRLGCLHILIDGEARGMETQKAE